MNTSFPNESTMDIIDFITTESESIAIEQNTYRTNIDEDYFAGTVTGNVLRMWGDFRAEWKRTKAEFTRQNLSGNLNAQKDCLVKERGIIEKYIHKMDKIPENALANIAFFVGLVALTVGLTSMVLTIPESAAIVSGGLADFQTGKVAELTAGTIKNGIGKATTLSAEELVKMGVRSKVENDALTAAATAKAQRAFTFHNMKTQFSHGITVASQVAQAATALKMMGLLFSYSDPTAKSIIKSQKATGVFSKQASLFALYRMRANVDKKLKVLAASYALDVDKVAQDTLNKYSGEVLEGYVRQTEKMQAELANRMVNTARNAYSSTYKPDKGSSDKNKGQSGSKSDKGNNYNQLSKETRQIVEAVLK